MNSLHDRLAYWASRTPERTVIIEAESGRRITYKQCFAAVQELRRRLGAPPRNMFAPLHGEILDALLWLTALTGGHLLFPLAPDAATEEIARATSMFEPDVLLLEEGDEARKFPGAQEARVITRSECQSIIERAELDLDGPLAPVIGSVCLMTSGTTGDPKGVVLNAEQIAWTADHVRISHRLTSDDIALDPLPLFHVNGPVVGVCGSIMAGGTVVLTQKFSRHEFWSRVEKYGVTWASIVPSIVAILLGTDRPSFLPGMLRFMRTGAAPLPPDQMRAFEDKFGIPLIETYGLSEAASQVTANPVPPEQRKPGSAGRPVGITLRICRPRRSGGEDLEDLPPGDKGEICVSGPSVISAYYGNADREAFQDGWFRTGDLGYQDKEGYVYIDGRLRDVIVRGGENIAPREVEEVLEAHPSVREAGVIGRPDPLLGEQVIAYIVPREPWSIDLEHALRGYVASLLSAHKVPVEFIPTNELPRNDMGKLRHRLLQKRDAARQQSAVAEALH